MNGHVPPMTPASRYAPLAASPLDTVDLVATNSFVVSDTANAILLSVADTMGSTSVFLSETEPWVQPLSLVLGPFLNFFSFAMVRSVLILMDL